MNNDDWFDDLMREEWSTPTWRERWWWWLKAWWRRLAGK